jgi:protein-disulfide isomerase
MPARKPTRSPAARRLTGTVQPNVVSRGLTLGDVFSYISNIRATQLLYVLLLVAVFSIGYLLARVQLLEKGGSQNTGGTTAPTQGTGTVPDPAAPDPKTVLEKLNNGHLPVKGDNNAKVTVVEFSDFECPFCARFYADTLPQLTTEYIDTGKIAFYYRHYPLSFHPQAVPAALASECANDQGKFWEMHDKIFDENNAGKLGTATTDTFKQYAADLGLEANAFDSCFDDKTHQAKVDEDFAAGNEVGVSGTPTFYINGRQMVGAQPFASLKAIIDEELNK